MATEATKQAPVVVHAANAKPEGAPVGTQYFDRERQLLEEWDGVDWLPVRSKPIEK